MKNGKISESVLKRSVLKQLHMVNEDVILKPGVGEDCAIVKTSGSTMAALSAQSVTLDIKDTHALARFSVYSAINNLASSGARPTGIMVTFLLPTLSNEAQLRETMKEIDKVCAGAGISVLGGHTQVTRAVKNIILNITAFGITNEITPSRAVKPGMDIIAAGYAGLAGTSLIAVEREEELNSRFSKAFIDKAEQYLEDISAIQAAESAKGAGAVAMHDVAEGGIFGALWDMAEASKCGMDIDLKKIPVKQETIEICEFFDINPYKLISQGCLIIAAFDGSRIVREINRSGTNAVIIGTATESNDRVLISGEEKRFLETAQTDEIYKIFK